MRGTKSRICTEINFLRHAYFFHAYSFLTTVKEIGAAYWAPLRKLRHCPVTFMETAFRIQGNEFNGTKIKKLDFGKSKRIVVTWYQI